MEEYYLMWLSRIHGMGYKRVESLIEHFGSATAVWAAHSSEFLEVKNLGEVMANRIIASRKEAPLEEWIEELEEKEISFLSVYHPRYPWLLREIADPPVGIYLKGVLPENERSMVSIVGARRCSRYGAGVAYGIAKDLAKANIVVVSGMALGIDAKAHQGILDGGGQTIAVLGCGVDCCYPEENRGLMERIKENGCLLSEFPPGTTPVPQNFPRRNRIISGLSPMTVVVEAGKRSGTLITADQALENGRDVYVVPGNVTSAYSKGTNNLIKQGCPVVTEYQDILNALGITYNERERANFTKKISMNLSDDEEIVYRQIGEEPKTAEEICGVLSLPIQTVQYALTLLEVAGHIVKQPQSGYIRAF